MTSEQAKLVIAAIRKHQTELLEISDKARHTDNYVLARERLQTWAARTAKMLAELLNGEEARKFHSRYPRVVFSDHRQTWNMAVQGYLNPLTALVESLAKFPQDHQHAPSDWPPPATTQLTRKEHAETCPPRNVLLIHGDDEVNLLRLERMLRTDHHLDVVVLSDSPEMGGTTIEQLEEVASDSSFAFVLYAADDAADAVNATHQQPRPGVDFALGWLCGRIGRDRTCLLHKKGTKVHADLDGVRRVEFDNDVRQAQAEILKELKAARILS